MSSVVNKPVPVIIEFPPRGWSSIEIKDWLTAAGLAKKTKERKKNGAMRVIIDEPVLYKDFFANTVPSRAYKVFADKNWNIVGFSFSKKAWSKEEGIKRRIKGLTGINYEKLNVSIEETKAMKNYWISKEPPIHEMRGSRPGFRIIYGHKLADLPE